LSRLVSAPDECVILVKALPHRSSNYFETVCCAGVGHDMRWRRLYPVAFRILNEDQQFKRWHWVSYRFTRPSNDPRAESQKVDHDTISVSKQLRDSERSRIARQLTRESTTEAESRGESLTLLRPDGVRFSWKKKSLTELEAEARKHADLANQLSMFNKPVEPLNPCPYEFSFEWRDSAGAKRNHTCDDWETSTAFFRRREADGEEKALLSLRKTYEEEYPQRGMRFALGTHSRRSNQWLLVGVLRVDEHPQAELQF